MLDEANQNAFNSLEWEYLYRIPEEIEVEKMVCDICGKLEDDCSAIAKFPDGNVYCQECASELLEQKEIEREDYENEF